MLCRKINFIVSMKKIHGCKAINTTHVSENNGLDIQAYGHTFLQASMYRTAVSLWFVVAGVKN